MEKFVCFNAVVWYFSTLSCDAQNILWRPTLLKHLSNLRSELFSRKVLNIEPHLRIESSQLRWFGHTFRMSQERLARQVLLVIPASKPTWNYKSSC